MRTAVCLSGQPREVNDAWPTLAGYLLKNLPHPDVFIHTSEPYPVTEAFFRLVRPKRYVIESQSLFPHLEAMLNRIDYNDDRHKYQNDYLQQVYGWKRVWSLKEDYESATGAKYDLAVRVRPDMLFLQPITLANIDPAKITVFCPVPESLTIDFAIGRDGLMAHYFKLFDWLVEGGESFLASSGRKREFFGQHTYDTIMRSYLFDYLRLPVAVARDGDGRIIKNPYLSYFRIMWRQMKGDYGPPLQPDHAKLWKWFE